MPRLHHTRLVGSASEVRADAAVTNAPTADAYRLSFFAVPGVAVSSVSHIYQIEVQRLLPLAAPVVATQLGQVSLGFVDTLMVGRLGAEALAGVALGNTTFFFILVMGFGVLSAVGPMVSQAFGAAAPWKAGRAVRQGFWLGLVLALPAMLLLWNVAPLWHLMGQADRTVEMAQAYLRMMALGLLPAFWFMALRCFVEGVSRPMPVTLIIFTCALLNVGANYVLMFGALGFPALGLVGTGVASAIVYAAMFGLLLLYVVQASDFEGYRIFEQAGRPDPTYFRALFRIGWPIGVQWGMEAGLFTMTALLVGLLGTIELAAHQIAVQCAAIAFMLPLGVGIATSVRVGQRVGARAPREARWAGYAGLSLATACTTGTALLFWLFPESIARAFMAEAVPDAPAVISLAATLLGVAAVFQLADGLQVAAAGALRGLKDTRVPMLLAFISYWGVGLGVGTGLGLYLELGAVGLWWGLVTGLTVAAVLLSWRFHRITRTLLDDTHAMARVPPAAQHRTAAPRAAPEAPSTERLPEPDPPD